MSRKVDKGFQLNYWKLSYRRRFVRNLWLLPSFIVLTVFIFWNGDKTFINRIIPIILLVIGIFELIYNYNKWKKCERS
ncbi:Uncharacterised protein [uncultured Clostridium sp.]|nr:Uncharacterised protein [uncultured Clostridium sp.]